MEIDVREFGARGDGLTDDAPAFRHALSSARRSKLRLLVPEGRYALAEDQNNPFTCLDMPADTAIRGTGVLHFARGVRKSVRLVRIAEPRVTLEGIGIDLASAPGGTSFGVSIQPGARETLVTDVVVRGNPARGGIQILGGREITLRGCQIVDMAQNGVTLYGDGVGTGPNNVVIDGCHISAGVQPIDCEPVNGALCRNVTVIRSHLVALDDNYAIALSGSHTSLIRDCTLRGALYLTNAVNARIDGCIIDATGSPEHDAVVAFAQSARCILVDNDISVASDRAGVHIAARSAGIPRDFRIHSNRVQVRGDKGIGVVVTDARQLRVVKNEIRGNGGVGVQVRTPSVAAEETVTVRDNLIEGFTRPVRMRVAGR